MTEEPTRPILRYHGGKWLLAPWIISHFPEHRVYVEPFGGAASVLLQKGRSYAEVYNDLDGEVVNLFRVVRDHGHELLQKLHLTPFSRVDFMDSYKRSTDPIDQAWRVTWRWVPQLVTKGVSRTPNKSLSQSLESSRRASSGR